LLVSEYVPKKLNKQMSRYFFLLALCLLMSIASAAGAEPSETIEEVVATGVQPGPKMWRLSKGEHELWIFGTLSPLPKDIEWDSESVEAVLADTQEFISPPWVRVNANPFKGILALPLLWGVLNNPDKQKLQDILSPELYQRWSTLKSLYIGSNRKIEKRRPIFAGSELFMKAIDATGLEFNRKVQKKINKLVKKHKIPTTPITITRTIEKPRALIKNFKRSRIDDVVCFEKTIHRLEVDLGTMRTRAIAWSSGDLATLKALPYENQVLSCIDAVLNSSFGSDLATESDLTNVDKRLEQKWIDAAKKALDTNTVSFATLPISELLDPNGYLTHFRNSDYQIRGG